MKQFKAHPSSLSKIMANGRSKDSMGETCKSYCEQWLMEQLSGKYETFESRYTAKGNEEEDNAIALLSFERGTEYQKNVETFENEWLIGTPDIIAGDTVIDIKNSYELFTHPLLKKEPKPEHVWQILGYMALTGCTKGEVVHCLLNPSQNIIDWEARAIAKARHGWWEDYLKEAEKKLSHGTLAQKYKIKVFQIAYDPEAIAAIEKRVVDCREYIETLKQQLP